jgi:exopolysaccharide production protein ExoY
MSASASEAASSKAQLGDRLEVITGAHARPLGGLRKRTLDILIALGAFLFSLPITIPVAAALILFDRGPLFYGHERIGQGGRRFRCLKFRSMRVDGDRILAEHLRASPAAAREWAETRKLVDDPRVTRLGQMLRKTSIDELPQLINVLRGEMSIVGPRPVVEEELDRYGPWVDYYLRARPGLTGAWQVSGRSDTNYRRRVELDCRYVEGWSIWRDLKIIILTVPVVLGRRGSY